ncbi:MAG: hypothetical protein HZB16_02965 [Armatimonadetes bacterium]|nr:hypothetical protein [Armatimonadota bacterium]
MGQPAWLSPRRLLPDLLAAGWLLVVATAYLGRHLLDAWALAMARLAG